LDAGTPGDGFALHYLEPGRAQIVPGRLSDCPKGLVVALRESEANDQEGKRAGTKNVRIIWFVSSMKRN
jgi:hypothetical protein